jgi:hypothetical protein
MTEFDNDKLAEIEDEEGAEIQSYHLVSDSYGVLYIIRDGADEEFSQWDYDKLINQDSEYDFSDAKLDGGLSSVHFYEGSFWVTE